MCGKHCPSLYMREKTVMKKMMKFCLFLCCILFISLPVQARTQGNLHALVMSGRILSRKNANDFYNLLKKTKIPEYKVSGQNIKKLFYENHKKTKRQDIFTSIDNAFKGSTKNDLNLFYYGGHGGAAATAEGYGGIYLGDVVNKELRKTRVSCNELLQTLLKYKGKFIVIIDSCNADLIRKAAAELKGSQRSRIDRDFIFIASSNEKVEEFGTQFTAALTDAVSTKWKFFRADENKDGCVSCAEWFVAARNNHKILAWYNQPNISSGNRELGNLKLIQLSHVKVLKKSLTMKKGQTKKVSYILKNLGRGSLKVRFSSSDSSIAAVDQKGKITPKKNGKVTVKAYLVDGSGKKCLGTEDGCVVTVQGFSTKTPSKNTAMKDFLKKVQKGSWWDSGWRTSIGFYNGYVLTGNTYGEQTGKYKIRKVQKTSYGYFISIEGYEDYRWYRSEPNKLRCYAAATGNVGRREGADFTLFGC